MEDHAHALGPIRLVESWFPYAEVSRLVATDRRSKDPVYGVHKWFARRPPTLVRALLIASHLEAEAAQDQDAPPPATQFWQMHSTAGCWLSDAVVYDPFMGGGTSLVESARMGATVVGRDVDPIAAAVVASELNGHEPAFHAAAVTITSQLEEAHGEMFVGPDPNWTPLHWFWLMAPTCGACGEKGLLYKDLVIATSSGRRGSVTRDQEMHAFCPICLRVHAIGPGRKEIRCCGRRHNIARGTYRAGRFRCDHCGDAATYEELGAASVERVMVAVEETHAFERRRIRTATTFDRELATAEKFDAQGLQSDIFDVELQTSRRDRRPVSAGFTSSKKLFTPRQWAVFTSAFTMVRTAGYSEAVERDLTLMLTGALASNNVLCGYARDWGRLAPLFSVRGFSIPALSVELNMFHPKAGRGTLRSARMRVADRSRASVRRARLVRPEATIARTSESPSSEEPSQPRPRRDPLLPGIELAELELPMAPRSVDVVCASADDTAGQSDPLATICVTDPPYFDYIAYSELSEFYRVWLRKPGLGGAPLLPDIEGDAVESFALGLGGALKATLTRLQPGVPLVFTYHSANSNAWKAIGDAFDHADLAVVALWPVLADPHMGHHTAEGNCEWDVVVVARRQVEVKKRSRPPEALPKRWVATIEAAGLKLGRADRTNFEHAWEMGQPRFARAAP